MIDVVTVDRPARRAASSAATRQSIDGVCCQSAREPVDHAPVAKAQHRARPRTAERRRRSTGPLDTSKTSSMSSPAVTPTSTLALGSSTTHVWFGSLGFSSARITAEQVRDARAGHRQQHRWPREERQEPSVDLLHVVLVGELGHRGDLVQREILLAAPPRVAVATDRRESPTWTLGLMAWTATTSPTTSSTVGHPSRPSSEPPSVRDARHRRDPPRVRVLPTRGRAGDASRTGQAWRNHRLGPRDVDASSP